MDIKMLWIAPALVLVLPGKLNPDVLMVRAMKKSVFFTFSIVCD